MHPTPVGGALYTLDIGGNDIFKALDELHAGQITPSVAGTVVAQAEANTVHAVEALFAVGARNLLFYEVPDLGLAPHFRAEGPAWQNLAGALAKSFDQTVLSDLVPLEHLGPRTIRVDNGPEFISRDLDLWAYMNGVTLDFSRPGKPTGNSFIEAFNGKVRAECIDQNWFLSMADAQVKCEAFRHEYNTQRPHSSIGNKTPTEFMKSIGASSRPMAS